MRFWAKFLLLCLLMIFASGCVHVISKDLRAASVPVLTLQQAAQNPGTYQGRMVVWGGEIIEAVNQADGTTQIEVFQRPLGWRDEPNETAPSEGRFLVHVDTYLDPYVYQRGRKITVAGEIAGEKVKRLGQMDYRYPLIKSKQVYLWPEYYYYGYYGYPYYYDPWWFYPRWYWGTGFYYFHRHR